MTLGPSTSSWKLRTISSRCSRVLPPWRKGGSKPRVSERWIWSRSPISRNWVNTSAFSPFSSTSSSMSVSRSSFPLRAL